jgi:hypothetical protein
MNESEDQNPNEFDASNISRRRRERRRIISPLTPDEKSIFIEGVLRKASPTFDFFIFSFLSGGIIGAAFLLDAPYMLVLGALLAPQMAPVVGVSLGAVLGSGKYFLRSFAAIMVASFLVTLVGTLSGFAASLLSSTDLLHVHLYTQLTWPPFIVIGIGAILTTSTLIKEKQRPEIPSVLLAYGLFLPLTAGGFGLGSGIPHLWTDGLVLFSIHLTWALILGIITLGIMGFKPYVVFGYSIGGVIIMILMIISMGVGGATAVIGGNISLPTYTNSPAPTLTPTQTQTPTPVPPTQTPSPTNTIQPSNTATSPPTLTPTKIQAIIDVLPEFGGAILRDEPNGKIITYLPIGALVELTGKTELDEANYNWSEVYSIENDEIGWILSNLAVTATPAQSSVESATATP